MAKVGPFHYWSRMVSRQFVKRVLRRDLTLVLPNSRTVYLPLNSAFSSVAWVTDGAVDDGLEVLLRVLGEQNTAFFDVGAHFGFYCSFLCDRHSPVVAFEPDTRTLPALRRNLAHIPDAQCIAAAVSDKEGQIRFSNAESAPQSRILSEGEAVRGGSVTTVPLVTLDQVWSNLGTPTVGVMKIDTEGHEEAVLRGAKTLIETCRPLILVEATGPSLAPHANWLDSFGYCALTLTDRHHALRQKVRIFAIRDIKSEFIEGMVLLVPARTRTLAAWAELEAGGCALSLSAGNWSSN